MVATLMRRPRSSHSCASPRPRWHAVVNAPGRSDVRNAVRDRNSPCRHRRHAASAMPQYTVPSMRARRVGSRWSTLSPLSPSNKMLIGDATVPQTRPFYVSDLFRARFFLVLISFFYFFYHKKTRWNKKHSPMNNNGMFAFGCLGIRRKRERCDGESRHAQKDARTGRTTNNREKETRRKAAKGDASYDRDRSSAPSAHCRMAQEKKSESFSRARRSSVAVGSTRGDWWSATNNCTSRSNDMAHGA